MPSTQEATQPASPALAWYRGLSGYQWFVLIVCCMAWFFDTFDMQIFLLARATAMKALVPAGADTTQYGGIATAVFMLGAATGGILFGILGDRWGRAKTLFTTVICYSLFTGLSAMSVSWVDFSFYRFLTGMGVGGTFAAVVSLVSETLPARSRSNALAALQAMGAVGNMLAAVITMFVQPTGNFGGMAGWRVIFIIGIAPSLLVLLVMRKLKEPEAWVQARTQKAAAPDQRLGSVSELFRDPRWRRNAVVGMALGMAGIMGLWGVGFWLPELMRSSLKSSVDDKQLGLYVSYGMLLFNFAAAVGTYLFGLLMGWIGRKPTFALGFIAAIASIICVFGFMKTAGQVWWMAPLLGFCTLSILGGYSVYFPELFPLRLRATGVGLCYNTARYIAAVAPFAIGMLTASLMADAASERGKAGLSELTLLSSLGGADNAIRYAAIIVSSVYLIGLLALPFAIETKGKPLPE